MPTSCHLDHHQAFCISTGEKETYQKGYLSEVSVATACSRPIKYPSASHEYFYVLESRQLVKPEISGERPVCAGNREIENGSGINLLTKLALSRALKIYANDLAPPEGSLHQSILKRHFQSGSVAPAFGWILRQCGPRPSPLCLLCVVVFKFGYRPRNKFCLFGTFFLDSNGRI